MPRFSNEMKQKDGYLIYPSPISPFDGSTDPKSNDPTPSPSSSSSSFSSISPILLLVIVILAVIFFISGLLHLLVRFLLKRSSPSIYQSNRYPERPGSHTLQRQLQQLFRLHDSGLDQTFIDALPVFLYKDIMGLKEPFDCAVCLYEFSDQDRLRLLPICSHAFHISCIDTWLLSNSTCPLCRATLLGSSFPSENPNLNEILGQENNYNRHPENTVAGNHQKRVTTTMEESAGEMRVLSVRLGKFKKLNNEEDDDEEEEIEEKGESSSQQNLNARRCYSMGTYQYVVGESDLQVMKEKLNTENVRGNGEMEGKKISGRSKGESFSVSKIWQWSKKSELPITSSSNSEWKTEVV
ncbi:RING-H2 finger protein ATL46-like [Cucumis melo var. makuwa]|uniref:RING-type E3 ubiquitin transferase n=2 Tax=Cucumis melo TaxID=3656 RepID=A0A5D3BJ90_CUCMM|nr:RING-H2 finger protein ATL46-like [Cucumis melo var. makuwa]